MPVRMRTIVDGQTVVITLRPLHPWRTSLVDGNGKAIHADGTTPEEVRDAIQAAALVDDFTLVEEIIARYGWTNICRLCASVEATVRWSCVTQVRRLCADCFNTATVAISYKDVKLCVAGLVQRDIA